MPEQGDAIERAQDKVEQIFIASPRGVDAFAVREFIIGLARPQEVLAGTGERIVYSELCDKLKIVFVDSKTDPELEQNDENGTARIKITEADGEMTMTMRQDASIMDLANLIRTIQVLSPARLSNSEQTEQMNEWWRKLQTYSENLQLAGLAMYRVIEKADELRRQEREKAETEMLSQEEAEKRAGDVSRYALLMDVAYATYALGKAIDVNKRLGGETSLEREYFQVEQEEKFREEAVDARLLPGLKYAWFGNNGDRELPGEPGQEFDRMAGALFRLGKRETNELPEELIMAIVDGAMMRHAKEVSRLAERAKEQRDKLPVVMAGALLMRGIEKAYQQIGIPKWIKVLTAADLDDPKVVENMAVIFEQGYGNRSAQIVEEYLGVGEMPAQLSDDEKKVFLQRYQESLRTLGLGKEELQRFSQWFEDENLFDEEKIKMLTSEYGMGRGLGLPDEFSWQKLGITSVKGVVEYYRARSSEVGMAGEFTMFQIRMVKLVMDEMRLSYSGWFDGELSGLTEASPSRVIQDEALNCVGRSWLLAEVGKILGVKVYAASSLFHVSVGMQFANGEVRLADPSVPGRTPGLLMLWPVNDGDKVLAAGETVRESWGGERYLLTEPNAGFPSSLLMNFNVNTGFFRKTRYVNGGIVLSSSVISNNLVRMYNSFGRLSIKTLAEQLQIDQGTAKKLVEKLDFLEPAFRRKIRDEFSTSLDFEAAVNDLYAEAGIS